MMGLAESWPVSVHMTSKLSLFYQLPPHCVATSLLPLGQPLGLAFKTVFTFCQVPDYTARLTEGPLDLLSSLSPGSSQQWATCAGPNGTSLSSTNPVSPELQQGLWESYGHIFHSLDSQAGHDITHAKNDVSAC